jgi:hypothetical protein
MADATTQSADDFLGADPTPPSADAFLGADPVTSTQSLLGPVAVAPAPPAPGSDENIKGMIRNLAGSNLVNGQERSLLSRYADTVAGPLEAAATTVTGTLAKPLSDIAGLAATAYDTATGNTEGDPAGFRKEVQERLTYSPRSDTGKATVGAIGDVGNATIGALARGTKDVYGGAAKAVGLPDSVSEGVGNAAEEAVQEAPGFLGLKGGRAAEAVTPGATVAKAPLKADAVDSILDTPDVVHEGSGAEPAVAPTSSAPATPSAPPAPSPAPEAVHSPAAVGATPTPGPVTPASKPQDNFMADLEAQSAPHPSEPTQRRIGNASVEAYADPTDPNTVHIQHFAADEPGKGQGTAAMQQLTDTADKHGVTLSLDAKPLAGESPIPPAKLEQFYGNHGFEPTEQGAGAMARPPEGAAPAASGIQVQEGGALPNALDAANHPMRSGEPYSMISSERPGAPTPENISRTQVLGQMLRKNEMTAAPAIGSFQGAPERSFSVATPTDAARTQVENMGKAFGRDSVLHVDADGTATLKNLNGAQPDQVLGKMTKVPQGEAESHASWTRDAQGNHYVVKPSIEAQAPHATRNGMGAEPEETMQSLYGGPAKSGSAEAEPTAGGQAARVAAFKDVGLDEVRNSAITGDYRAAGTEFQTSKLKGNPAGDRLAGVIDQEHQALRKHAEDGVDMAGGSKGLGQTELHARGSKMEAPVRGLHEHLEDAMNQAYETAKVRAAGKTAPLDAFSNMVNNKKSAFSATAEGVNLRNSIFDRAKELDLLDKGGNFQAAPIENIERMRQHLNDAWSPRTNKLIGQLKGTLDQDVGRAVGQDVFEKGRSVRALMSKILEEPEGVSKLLQTKQANKAGINRQVDLENVPSYVTKLPFDQIRQYVSVLKQAAGAGVPKLRNQAQAALKETRAQFANEYQAAGDNLKGQWNQKAGNKYLKDNEMAMRYVFSPEEMQHFVNSDNAGRWLSMDRSYPGAEAQKQNIAQHVAEMASHHVPNTVAGGAVGGVLGHVPGALAGAAVGKVIGAGASKLAAQGAEKLITQLDQWKPPKAAKPNSNQRGSFSFENATPLRGAPKNTQRGGSVKDLRNPRSEYNANKQIAGAPKRTEEQEGMLDRLLR